MQGRVSILHKVISSTLAILLTSSVELHCAIVQHLLMVFYEHLTSGNVRTSVDLLIVISVFIAHGCVAIYMFNHLIRIGLIRNPYGLAFPIVVVIYNLGAVAAPSELSFRLNNYIMSLFFHELELRYWFVLPLFLILLSAPWSAGLLGNFYEKKSGDRLEWR